MLNVSDKIRHAVALVRSSESYQATSESLRGYHREVESTLPLVHLGKVPPQRHRGQHNRF